MDLLAYIQSHYPTYQHYFLGDRYEYPKDPAYAEIALPCFLLAKELGKSPVAVAQEIAGFFVCCEGVERIEAVGPYVNFSFDAVWIADQLIPIILREQDQYGKGSDRDERIVLESPGPNTNKPLHLGHVRNMLLGTSLGNILRFAGYEVVPVDVINDRGAHICKSMLAYLQEGNDREPDKKSDHFVGDWYVRFAQLAEQDPSLEERIQAMLVAREQGDPTIRALRSRMNNRAIAGMQQTYHRYGVSIKKAYFESDHYLKGKAIVEQGLQTGLFTYNEKKNVVYRDDELGEKVVLRADGTAIYLTQDLALAQVRYEDWHMDRMIYVVGNEQEDHFKFLFRILQCLGYGFAEKCFHLSYGMISLPDGKMKSRQGNTVDADSLADQMHAYASTMIEERYPELSSVEKEKRAEAIAMAAIKFFVLKYDASKDFVFDREHSLSFEGETGPYIQYASARCATLLQKATVSPGQCVGYSRLTSDAEKKLLVQLSLFPQTVEVAADLYQPALIARYALHLAHLINTYYHHERVLDDNYELQEQRLSLIQACRIVLNQSLSLLGIEALDEM